MQQQIDLKIADQWRNIHKTNVWVIKEDGKSLVIPALKETAAFQGRAWQLKNLHEIKSDRTARRLIHVHV